LAAILAADISGYSRLMGQDEAATVRDLKGHQSAILPLVGRHGGRIIRSWSSPPVAGRWVLNTGRERAYVRIAEGLSAPCYPAGAISVK
jgi:class 3 adenylate cyclase